MEKLKKYFLENPFIIFLPFMCLVLPFILFDEVGYQCVISLVWTLVGFVGIFTYKISEDIKTHLFMSFVIFLLGFVGGQDIRSTEKTTTEFTEDYTIEETEYFLIFRRDKYITCVIRRDSTLKYDTDNPLVIYEVYKSIGLEHLLGETSC